MASGGSAKGTLTPTVRKRLAEVRTCEKSGETLKSYAARHGISVHSLYQAKKLARRHGMLAPHRARKAERSPPRSSPPRRFVEAIRRAEVPERGATWRVRFPSGVVLESSAPLAIDEALRLIDRLGGAP
jgi:transposase-like protein